MVSKSKKGETLEIAVYCYVCRRRFDTLVGCVGYSYPKYFDFCKPCVARMVSFFERQMATRQK